MKVYITKYALTTGIEIANGEVCEDTSTNMISVESEAGYSNRYFHGLDWHRTLEAALKRANQMRAAKIASLKKKIVKLENMTFDVKEAA
jgi:hypothetical protein